MGELILAVCGPSGVGKSSLCSELIRMYDDLDALVSHTTRDPRSNESDGSDYHFISEEEFTDRKSRGEFIEWTHIYGAYYGTSRSEVQDKWSDGYHLITDLDYRGVRSFKDYYQDRVQAILITPPSIRALRDRFQSRNSTHRSFDERMKQFREALNHLDTFDYVVQNDCFDETVSTLRSIYCTSRHLSHIQDVDFDI